MFATGQISRVNKFKEISATLDHRYKYLGTSHRKLSRVTLNRGREALPEEGVITVTGLQGVLYFQNIVQFNGTSMKLTLFTSVRNIQPSPRQFSRKPQILKIIVWKLLNTEFCTDQPITCL
jgi:hypothetical protein